MRINNLISNKKIFYFAHRGASFLKEENTVESFAKAIELGCEDVDAWVGRGMAFNNLGRGAEAYADIKKAWAMGYVDEENRSLRERLLAGFYYYRARALVGLRAVWRRRG